jgi:CRP/FNR family transcriptional regulator, cyclic AMP receptor protein
MPATACACRHSYTAHVVGSSKGCSFCNCRQFVDTAEEAPQAAPKPLSDQAKRALSVLAETAAFQHVSRDRLREIADLGRRRLFLTGTVMMHQGDDSDTLHIMVKGNVKIERQAAPGNAVLLAELQPGDIVGEMGVLNGDARSATVTAQSDVETLEVSAAQLKEVFQQDPEVLLAIMKVINERLKTTEDLVETSIRVALAQLGSDR